MSAKNREKRKLYGRLRPSEIVLGIIAVLMLLGWAFHALDYGGPPETTPVPPPETTPSVFPWFATFSVPSAVLVLVLIFLKLNCIALIPRNGQEKMLPYISLLPVLGFLIAELGSVQTFLTVGGAVALAYISATSYWRNYIPEFITNPLGTESAPETQKADDSASTTPAKDDDAASAIPAKDDVAASATPAKDDDAASATPAKEDDSASTTTPSGEESAGEKAPPEEAKKETTAEPGGDAG